MRILLLLAVLLTALTTQGQTYYGMLQAGEQAIPVNIALEETGGSLQSPQQLETRLPFSEYTQTADSLHFAIAQAGLSFRGAIHTDRIEGEFRQGTFSTSLTFYPDPPDGYPLKEQGARPQDPTDFPYLREEVSFAGGAAGVKLVGELTLPDDTPPRALIVLVSGSGPQDRNADLGPPINHRPFLVLSDYLTRRGYGVLRYDERGIGESTGNFAAATSADFATDARAAVTYLRQRDDLQGVPVGIAGHSEGGMIAPMVASDEPVDFLVLLAAPGLRGDTLLLDQRRAILGQVPPDEPVYTAVYDYIRRHGDQPDSLFRRGLEDTVQSVIPQLPAVARASITNVEAYTEMMVTPYASPWMRYFVAHDPEPSLERVTVPVLALNGALDQQVTVRNLEAVGVALERAGNDDVTLLPLPGVNHLLQPATTGAPAEYGQIETTIAPVVLKEIEEWLDARFGDR